MSEIKLTADSGGGTTSIKAPSSTTSKADVVLKLPVADGSANQVLKTDGSGQLSFTSNAGTTINNNATTKFITGTNNANELDCEANLSYNNSVVTFSSSNLSIDKSTNPTVTAKETAGNKEVQLRANTTGGLLRTAGSYPLVLGTNQTERMRITSSGQLLLATASTSGVSSDADDLIIGSTGDSTNRGITFATSGEAAIRWADAGDNAMGRIEYSNSTDNMTLHTSNAERLRITSSGNVGINKTDPSDKFHVEGTTNFTGNSYIGGDLYMYGSSYTKGIFLGGSGSANKLDDYEEGTWTPVVGGWDTYSPYSGASYNYNWYVKIGQLVHVGWKLYIQNLTTPATSGSQHIRITGLPFAHQTYAAGAIGHIRFDIPEYGMSGYPIVYLAGGGTILYMYKHVNGSNNLVAMNAAANRSNVWCMGTATYATSA